MTNFRSVCGAVLLCIVPTVAPAVSLSSLTSGGSLVVGDVTFSGWSFTEIFPAFNNITPDPADIDVVGTISGPTIDLDFSFDPILAATVADDVTEFNVGFTATVTGSSREFTGVEYTIETSSSDITSDFAVIEFVSLNFGTLSADVFTTTDSEIFAPTSTFGPGFAVQAESEGGLATVSDFEIGLTLNSSYVAPPVPVVPVPAPLVLLAGGLGVLGAFRFRRKA